MSPFATELETLRQMTDSEWAERLARELKPGMLMSSPGGGMIKLIRAAAPHYGDQRQFGPVWHVQQLRPRGPETTAYVQFFNIGEVKP